MNVLGNIFWLILGGLIVAIIYYIVGLLMCITIIGIPFGVQLFKLGPKGGGHAVVQLCLRNGCAAFVIHFGSHAQHGVFFLLNEIFFFLKEGESRFFSFFLDTFGFFFELL